MKWIEIHSIRFVSIQVQYVQLKEIWLLHWIINLWGVDADAYAYTANDKFKLKSRSNRGKIKCLKWFFDSSIRFKFKFKNKITIY